MRARDLVDFAATALVDEDGRPVAEVASPLYRTTPTELVACPYHDARGDGPMNRSALAQMQGAWPSLLAAFAALAGPSPTVHRAWVAAVTAIALPLIAPAPVPRVVSGLFKTSLGLSQAFTAMLLSDDGVADAPLAALGDGRGFYRTLDDGRWLVGASQVCAGSPAMIAQAFDALCGRAPAVPLPEVVSGLAARVGDAPPRIVGLHVAHLLGQQACARRGDGPPVSTEIPWLRAVFAVPNRPADHARRLFPAGAVPPEVEAHLAAATDRAALEARFDALLAALESPAPGQT